jgi:hypothetical protein
MRFDHSPLNHRLLKLDPYREQATLRSQLITHDVHSWSVPGGPVCPLSGTPQDELRFVGGVDVSFSQTDLDLACAALVVIDLSKLHEPASGSGKFVDDGGGAVVYEECELVRLDVPYLPGFLGFREVPVLRPLLERVAREKPEVVPQVSWEEILYSGWNSARF